MTQARSALLPLLALLALVLISGCGEGKEDDAKPGPLTWEEAVVLNNRGVALMDQQRIGEAIKIFREITERAPQSAARLGQPGDRASQRAEERSR